MRFLADESLPRPLVEALRLAGHDLTSVATESPGSSDEQVLQRAQDEGRVLLTLDRDFGRLTFDRRLPASSGIVLFRIRGSRRTVIDRALEAIQSRDDWAGYFAVVESGRVRLIPLPSTD